MRAEYPDAICHSCGVAHSRGNHASISTYHVGVCGWCGERTHVTEPRDYGWPPAPLADAEDQRK